MNAPTLKLRYGAPLRPVTRATDSPFVAGSGPAAAGDLVLLEPAASAACPGPPEMARCLGPESESGGPCDPPAPPASASQAVCLEPAPEVAPHQLAAFATALEALDGPAFLMRPNGEMEHANAAARDWLERDRPEAAARLDEALRSSASHALVTIPVSFGSGGRSRPWQMVTVRPQADREAERVARVAAASARWSLSARQREVLQLVVEGLSVPTIAAVLGCVEKTVGSHLNAVFKKALVESRAELTAKVWMG